jgi:hypothetical protein
VDEMAVFSKRRHGVRGARGQALAFYNRSRRNSLYDPTFELFRTHNFLASGNPIDTDAAFPGTRLEGITFGIDITRTGSSSNGILFEFGDSSRGCAAAIDGADIIFAVGENAASDNGVTLTASNVILAEDQLYRLVFATLPGTGGAVIWVNGRLVSFGQSVNQNFNGSWSGDADGAIGDVEGTVTDRIPAPQRVSLAECDINGYLNVFNKQLPRQFVSLEAAVAGGDAGSPIGLLLALTKAS